MRVRRRHADGVPALRADDPDVALGDKRQERAAHGRALKVAHLQVRRGTARALRSVRVEGILRGGERVEIADDARDVGLGRAEQRTDVLERRAAVAAAGAGAVRHVLEHVHDVGLERVVLSLLA